MFVLLSVFCHLYVFIYIEINDPFLYILISSLFSYFLILFPFAILTSFFFLFCFPCGK